MITYKSAPLLMQELAPQQAGTWDSWPKHPTLDQQGLPILFPGEEVVTQENPKSVPQEGFVMPQVESMEEMTYYLNNRAMIVALKSPTLVITTHRTIWTTTHGTPGSIVAGHVWHAWLDWVEFNPRQSLFIEAMLRLHFMEDFPNPTSGFFGHFIEFGFDKQFDPTALGTALTKIVAAHHLNNDAPVSTHESLKKLSQANPPPPPPKKETAMFIFPAHINYPRLPASLNLGHEGEWILNGD